MTPAAIGACVETARELIDEMVSHAMNAHGMDRYRGERNIEVEPGLSLYVKVSFSEAVIVEAQPVPINSLAEGPALITETAGE